MQDIESIEIVLVEDSDADAALTVRALRKHRLVNGIHRLRDGAEALDFFFPAGGTSASARLRPRVVQLDLKLPKVSGIDVLRRLKTDPATRAIPVVVLTSSREDRDLVESYRLGVNSYGVKPVEFEQFVGAVAHLGLYWSLLNQRASA